MEKKMEKEKKIKFSGEYKNGEWNGEGTEYYQNGIIKFNGEFLNGVKFIKK